MVNYGKSNIAYSLLLDLALVIFSITFGGAFCVLLKSEDIVTKILNLVINVLAILSGLFFPMYIFGEKIANLSALSPISKVMSTFLVSFTIKIIVHILIHYQFCYYVQYYL